MQQRRLRLGDIVDDYCPRERRLTNHAVVAMIDDQVRQTRCTTCGADHDYRQARVPARKKKDLGTVMPASGVSLSRPSATGDETAALAPRPADEPVPTELVDSIEPVAAAGDEHPDSTEAGPIEDEGPVHRRLIRATLPRPDGQVSERKPHEFTVRQPGGQRGNGQGRHRQGRGRRHARGPAHPQGQSSGVGGGERHGSQNQRTGQGQPGNRGRGGSSSQRHGRSQRHGGGSGRKRGR